ncbi:uncharacterized protein L201_002111 [Kwoniella dendrophila CBS 6074]|uniref:Znf1 n=1 Tax=Kwoniella dendrophila CBS 6074 TaxID=1295534 RepID=A0AAX4JRV9_9TREE
MVFNGYKVTSAKLANGEIVAQNDHVYVSLPWSERDGTPYNIARIIEFLPPNTSPKKGSRAVSSGSEIMVRLSLYYRPPDVSLRPMNDFRLLFAAIHTDIQPISNVRGKCYVRHKDRIDDLLKWKKLPDHFYFVKFYDPYIKRDFEVIRTESVNNIPQDVKKSLMSRYEYLVTEREMVADLTEAFRSCCVCDKWASYQESVKCEACKKHYHMSCLTPPLIGKPAKGYSWFCIPCSFQRHKDVESEKFRFTTNGSSTTTAKSKQKAKNKITATDARPDVTFRGWPWRYFGVYTTPEDTLDPEDAIFPRAATRVGSKYQANVPSWEEQEKPHLPGMIEAEAGPSRHGLMERGYEPGERKYESTIDVRSRPDEELNKYMEDVRLLKLAVPAHDVERLNLAIDLYTSLGREKAIQSMRKTKLADFKPINFSDKETAIFEAELERNGGLETHETAKLLNNRTPAEVLRFSYIWKNKQLSKENEALRHHHKVSTSHARQNKTLGAPSLGRIRVTSSLANHSDDEVSLYGNDFIKEKEQEKEIIKCAACSTRISSVWWRCPRTVQGETMCEDCGSNYRKYGVISFVKSEDSKKDIKKDAAQKKAKGDGSGTATPVPLPPPKLPPCANCKKMEPKAMMARCKNCTYSVHSGCYGIPSQDMGSNWECDLCLNAKSEENHLEPQCVLCPRDLTPITSKIKRKSNQHTEFDLLSALKPTEGRRWAHILCSAYIPEVGYSEPERMKTVEGVMEVSEDKWENQCTLCNQNDGAVIGCTDCGDLFHPACAWLSGYKMGFEFSLAKPGRHGQVIVTKFKDSEGVMGPGLWCKSHDLNERVIYDLWEIDPEQNETALQIYISSYKAIPPHDSFATLRKAKRLENHLPHIIINDHNQQQSIIRDCQICEDCDIDVSPLWHQVDSDFQDIKDERMDIDDNGDVNNQVDDKETHTNTNHLKRKADEMDELMNGKNDNLESKKGKGKKNVCHLCWFNYR